MKETKIVFDDVNNQPIVSKIDTDIISIDREDKPLIYISEEAIYLKRDNDNLREENSKQYKLLKKIKELIQEYKYTNIEDYPRIMEFYKKIDSLLEEIE